MKIGIMQPYFFPYIGYFQLIKAVDVYVNLDHVSFMKRSYMVRNKLKNNIPINIPVIKATQNKSCIDIKIKIDKKYIDKFWKTIHYNYSKEKQYEEVSTNIFGSTIGEIVNYEYDDIAFLFSGLSISEFNLYFIKQICNYLDIDTQIINSSDGLTDKPKNEGLLEITKQMGGDTYINAIGGKSLYNKKNFESSNINLNFIEMGELEFDTPYASILDILYRYDKDHIKKQLIKYKLT